MDTPHDPQLRLDPLVARLPLDRPFTPRHAAGVGVARSALERLVRCGQVRRVLRGVYAPAAAPDDTTFRARALALAVGGTPVAVDRTAGWVHGLDLATLGVGDGQVPLDLARTQRRSRGSVRSLAAREIACHEGLRVTTPLRTALDLGRLLPPGPALTALDRLVGRGAGRRDRPRGRAAPDGRPARDRPAARAGGADRRPGLLCTRVGPPAALERCPPPDRDPRPARRRGRPPRPPEHRHRAPRLRRRARRPRRRRRPRRPPRRRLVDRRTPRARVLQVQPDTLVKHLEREYHQHLLARVEAAG